MARPHDALTDLELDTHVEDALTFSPPKVSWAMAEFLKKPALSIHLPWLVGVLLWSLGLVLCIFYLKIPYSFLTKGKILMDDPTKIAIKLNPHLLAHLSEATEVRLRGEQFPLGRGALLAGKVMRLKADRENDWALVELIEPPLDINSMCLGGESIFRVWASPLSLWQIVNGS